MKKYPPMVLGMLMASVSYAKEIKQTVLFGVGADSCGSYVFALSEDLPLRAVVMEGKKYTPMAGTYIAWAAGAITQQNLYTNSETAQINIDLDGVALWLKKYCDENPTKPFAFSVAAFIHAHSKD